MRTTPIRILLVEDNPGHARFLRENLADAGGSQFQLVHVETLGDAIERLKEARFDVLFLDLSLPDSFGIETVSRARAAAPELPIVVMTSSDDEHLAVDAVRHGAQDYLVKGQTHERLLLRSVYYAIERKRAEEELEARVRERTAQLAEANRALQAEFAEHKRLQNEVLEVSEREQRRIGQDLHDVLGQNLTAIMFVVDALEERLASKSLPEADDAAKAIKLLDQAVAQARSLARGLCPVRLEADGLMAALEEFASNIAANFGIPCSFECRSPVLVRDSAVAIHLFRIAQEAVHNAIKHAKPSQIAIRLRESGGRITLAVQDDGGGIPREAGTRKGLGLQIMNYRASLLGGALSIQPPPGGGTLVTCSVPSERAAGQERMAPHS